MDAQPRPEQDGRPRRREQLDGRADSERT
eukprot:COSAG04_NODE_3546_length_2720_cov_1.898512_3_plen_28_part_01